MATLEVTLTSGEVALIDEQDFALVSAKKWTADYRSDGRIYAKAHVRKPGTKTGRSTVYMHRLIMGDPAGYVDHDNHNTLDNRRSNLRVCTNSLNQANRNPRTFRAESGYLGVYRDRARWRARLQVNGRRVGCGTYATPEEAARARDEAAIECFGEFASLNFAKGGEG